MSDVTDLVEWLRAQLDDDERLARELDTDPMSNCYFDCIGDGHGDHHLRWDGERVLAEVDAKRKLLDAHAAAAGADDYGGIPSGFPNARANGFAA